jgi:hypothetical protein
MQWIIIKNVRSMILFYSLLVDNKCIFLEYSRFRTDQYHQDTTTKSKYTEICKINVHCRYIFCVGTKIKSFILMIPRMFFNRLWLCTATTLYTKYYWPSMKVWNEPRNPECASWYITCMGKLKYRLHVQVGRSPERVSCYFDSMCKLIRQLNV